MQVLLHAARVRLVKERKMHSVIREIVFYFLFVWMVLLIAYGHRDPYAHFMTQNMENTFVGYQESLGHREEDKISSRKPAEADDAIKLYDVSTYWRNVAIFSLYSRKNFVVSRSADLSFGISDFSTQAEYQNK